MLKPSKDIVLKISNLSSWYGKVQILHEVDMHVKKGELVSIIGPNGAGKSTILKNIFGIIKKRKGNIKFLKKEIITMQPEELAKIGIAIVPQGRSVFPSLTVEENLVIGAYTRSDNIKKDLEYVYDKFPVLKERRNQPAKLLSGGEQQMVSMGRSLMVKPKLLLLDEPTLGLSPSMKKLIFDKIIELNKSGLTILMVEQNARMSLKLSDRAYVLELGRNRYVGKGKTLLKDKRIQHLYLGGVA